MLTWYYKYMRYLTNRKDLCTLKYEKTQWLA